MTPRLFEPNELPISGEVQFWRLDPTEWADALTAVRDLGIGTIATYLSWRRHEPTRGDRDLRGRHGPRLDVHRFLSLCHDHRMRVILKPGPWICAEETAGGLPDWIVSDPDLIALDSDGLPVMGYNPPFKHPMPSYASGRFRSEVARWLEFVWSDLAEFLSHDGPVVATQYDNEPSLGFQDSMYGFDRHRDAMRSWHSFANDTLVVPTPPPEPSSTVTPVESRWIAWQRAYLTDYLAWLRDTNYMAGAALLAGTVNLNTHPVRGMPQDGGAIADALPGVVVGEDHYFVPPLDTSDLAGLALAAAQAHNTDTPLIWAPEMQAGIWRSPGEHVVYPDPTARELAGWWGAALALGYQGFNLYMLVNRDNWEYAPLGRQAAGDQADALRELLATARSVPDLTEFRPIADVSLPWNDGMRAAAYRVYGTQSSKTTDWDDAAARRAYDAVEAAAVTAIDLSLQFSLDPHHPSPTEPVVMPEANVTAPPGILARLHQHPDGRRLLYLVPWHRDVCLERVQIRIRHQPTPACLVDVRTRSTYDADADGSIVLPELSAGLNLFRIVMRPDL